MKKQGVNCRVEAALALPAGTLSDSMRMELIGNRRMVVEGVKRVLHYDEDSLVFRTVDGDIRIYGRRLCVVCLSKDHTVITGTLSAVEYL